VATEELASAALRDVRPEIVEGARAIKSAQPAASVETIDDLATARTFCAAWGVTSADRREGQPVISDVPALALAGRYDPVTPASNGIAALQTLARGYLIELPNSAHFAALAHADCGFAIVAAFLDDPSREPDASCAQSIPSPEWLVP
jgi:pimeloyl-ACP methyl ester carboxylesterase